mmetsp:Transcript_10986/g.19638  ORF Transcript_10986/g.19638 Transcript_10986/m.19638 type:complete len:254 (+) Transcript_10986:517-1278(+)
MPSTTARRLSRRRPRAWGGSRATPCTATDARPCWSPTGPQGRSSTTTLRAATAPASLWATEAPGHSRTTSFTALYRVLWSMSRGIRTSRAISSAQDRRSAFLSAARGGVSSRRTASSAAVDMASSSSPTLHRHLRQMRSTRMALGSQSTVARRQYSKTTTCFPTSEWPLASKTGPWENSQATESTPRTRSPPCITLHAPARSPTMIPAARSPAMQDCQSASGLLPSSSPEMRPWRARLLRHVVRDGSPRPRQT